MTLSVKGRSRRVTRAELAQVLEKPRRGVNAWPQKIKQQIQILEIMVPYYPLKHHVFGME
jgi:hypothetical protein